MSQGLKGLFMLGRVIIFALIAAGVLFLPGCATIIHGGTSQEIIVDSTPSGGKITVNGISKGTTPSTIDVSRSGKHRIRIQKEGYEPYEISTRKKISGWFFGNILFGGLIGICVDAIGGSAFDIEPEVIQASLRKSEVIASAPKPGPVPPPIRAPAVERLPVERRTGMPAPDDEVPLIAEIDNYVPPTGMSNPDAVAVVIGNRRYRNRDIPEVRYAHNDARMVKEYLRKTLGYRESNIIYLLDATKSEMEQVFGIKNIHEGRLYDIIKPGKSDVFIYYSGHGAPDLNTKRGYFIPSDCASTRYAISGYSLDTLFENISRLEARDVTVVIDACFSGSTNQGSSLVGSSSPCAVAVGSPAIDTGNTICLTSSEGDQVSSWYDQKHHGLFTYFFLKGLGGAAKRENENILTYRELFEFISDRTEGVPYWARYLHHGRKQTPTLQGRGADRPIVKYY